MSDDRYEVITWRGHKFDRYTVAAVEAAEALLGHTLTVMQGSYNGGSGRVSASAGTHDGGGAVDFGVGKLVTRDVRVLRSVGFAAWHRLPSEGPWGAHVHCILIGNTAASTGAKRQVESYRRGFNGLASNKRDYTWRPTPIPTFKYPEAPVSLLADLTAVAQKHNVTRLYAARVLIKEALLRSPLGSRRHTRIAAARLAVLGMDKPATK